MGSWAQRGVCWELLDRDEGSVARGGDQPGPGEATEAGPKAPVSAHWPGCWGVSMTGWSDPLGLPLASGSCPGSSVNVCTEESGVPGTGHPRPTLEF